VHHKRIGGKREHLVEQQESEEVAGQGDAHGAGDTEAEETEETAAVGRALEVPHGVDGGQQPENGGETGKHHGKRIGFQGEGHPGQHRETQLVIDPRNTPQTMMVTRPSLIRAAVRLMVVLNPERCSGVAK